MNDGEQPGLPSWLSRLNQNAHSAVGAAQNRGRRLFKDSTSGQRYRFVATTFLGGFFDAQRAFMASDKRLRPAAVNPVRFFAVCFSAFRTAAHRRLVAAMIASRPSGDRTRFVPVRDIFPGGLPRFFVAGALLPLTPRSAASARSIAVRCFSRLAMMLSMSVNSSPPFCSHLDHSERLPGGHAKRLGPSARYDVIMPRRFITIPEWVEESMFKPLVKTDRVFKL
jgi:hypothetical protein